jgi:hypothetical protein
MEMYNLGDESFSLRTVNRKVSNILLLLEWFSASETLICTCYSLCVSIMSAMLSDMPEFISSIFPHKGLPEKLAFAIPHFALMYMSCSLMLFYTNYLSIYSVFDFHWSKQLQQYIKCRNRDIYKAVLFDAKIYPS